MQVETISIILSRKRATDLRSLCPKECPIKPLHSCQNRTIGPMTDIQSVETPHTARLV